MRAATWAAVAAAAAGAATAGLTSDDVAIQLVDGVVAKCGGGGHHGGGNVALQLRKDTKQREGRERERQSREKCYEHVANKFQYFRRVAYYLQAVCRFISARVCLCRSSKNSNSGNKDVQQQ